MPYAAVEIVVQQLGKPGSYLREGVEILAIVQVLGCEEQFVGRVVGVIWYE